MSKEKWALYEFGGALFEVKIKQTLLSGDYLKIVRMGSGGDVAERAWVAWVSKADFVNDYRFISELPE